MNRVIVRRPRRSGNLAGPALLGLALGALTGIAVGEWWLPRATRLEQPGPPPRHRSMARLVHDAQAALSGDSQLGSLALEVIPVSRETVELRGWVVDRRLRARAYRIVCEAVGSDAVVNSILVRGEDDDPSDTQLDAAS
ncbi:MAG TPA: BON domain-containing protein [Gemmatimonadales bacterium]|nr:BON domain-containing protein [Gemmatimonadales bacterium]